MVTTQHKKIALKKTLRRLFFTRTCSVATVLLLALLFLASFVAAPSAHATSENDRMYSLEGLSWLKPIDNVDGIFNDFIDQVYGKYFNSQTRFQVKKIGNTNTILSDSKVPYFKLVKDPEVLRKIARQFRVESLIRTSIEKEGGSYRFVLEWVYAPRGDILSQFEFRYIDPGKDTGLMNSDLPQTLNKALDELISKLPFLGQITGVEGEVVTVNMGRLQGLEEKEILTVYTLQTLKRHPLDYTIEEWRWAPIGKVQVTQVEDSLSFAKIIDTEPNQAFDRFQKIREILPAPPETPVEPKSTDEDHLPRIGWVAGNLGLGSYSREVGNPGTSNGVAGSGLWEGGELDGQFWFNSRWIAQASFMTAFLKYNATDLNTGASLNASYSGSSTQFRLAVGYCFFPTKTIFDPTGWVHVGYKTTSYNLTADQTNEVGSSSFGSLFIGLGGSFPIDLRFSAQMGFDIGLLRSFSQSDLNLPDTGSTSDLEFNLGGAYRYTEKVFFRLMFTLNSQSADFVDGHSISQKTFSLMPSVMYYF